MDLHISHVYYIDKNYTKNYLAIISSRFKISEIEIVIADAVKAEMANSCL